MINFTITTITEVIQFDFICIMQETHSHPNDFQPDTDSTDIVSTSSLDLIRQPHINVIIFKYIGNTSFYFIPTRDMPKKSPYFFYQIQIDTD